MKALNARPLLITVVLWFSQRPADADIVTHAKTSSHGDTAYTFDPGAYKGDLKSLPIGIFDSGIGGLTVMEAILGLDTFNNENLRPGPDGKPDFVDESFIYFGDQANMPYGNYSSVGRTDYLRELILKDAIFLLGSRWFDPKSQTFRNDKPPVKAIVIACNTATAYGIEDIRDALKKWNLPIIVIGVVEAGARGVQETHQAGAVGVLATVGTCASGAYPRVIGRTLGLAGRTIPAITQQGSSSLAGVIEGDPAFPATLSEQCQADVSALVESHRQSGAKTALSTVVLGCTHFPLVQNEIEAALNQLRQQDRNESIVAEKIQFVNPAEWTARELFKALALARLRAPHAPSLARSQFFLSVPSPLRKDLPLSPDGGLKKEYKYSRAPRRLDEEDTVNIPLSPARIPESAKSLIETKLPLVWARIQAAP